MNNIFKYFAITSKSLYLLISNIHELVSKVFIINLDTDNSCGSLLGALALEDGVSGGHNCGSLVPNVERNREHERFRVVVVIIDGSLVPNFVCSLVVDLAKVSRNGEKKIKSHSKITQN